MAAHQRNQLTGMRGRIVDAIEHAVLKGDEVARRKLLVSSAGAQQLIDRVFTVQRYQLVAQGVARRMQ